MIHTFVTYSVAGGGILAYLDLDAVDHNGRTEGVVRFYDMKYTGDAPQGSTGQGFTVDGQFISGYYLSDFLASRGGGINLNTGSPFWALREAQYQDVCSWIKQIQESQADFIPE